MTTPITLLIPGYLGTRLRHRGNGRLVWGNFRSLYRTTPEELTGDCEPAGAVETITVIPRVWAVQVYGRLKRAFGTRMIEFAYDWRLSHAETGRELARFISRLKRPVHAIAHSTGGYVLDYCLRYGDAALDTTHDPTFPLLDRFASITFVGVPWNGTVAAARDLTTGWRAAPFGRRFPSEMVHSFASAHEALPAGDSTWRSPDGTSLPYDPFKHAPTARLFRAVLTRGPQWSPVQTHLIVSDRFRTRAAVCVSERGLRFNQFWAPGDGTVTLESALRENRTDLPSHVTLHRVRGRHRTLLSHREVIRLLQTWTGS